MSEEVTPTMFVNAALLYILGFFVGMGVCIASQRWSNGEFLAAVVVALMAGPAAHYLFLKVRL